MKRLFALLLCLALLLPVFAAAEDDEDDFGIEDLLIEEIELDEDGNFITEDSGTDYDIGYSDEEILAMDESMVYGDDETVDLMLNTNLPTDEHSPAGP